MTSLQLRYMTGVDGFISSSLSLIKNQILQNSRPAYTDLVLQVVMMSTQPDQLTIVYGFVSSSINGITTKLAEW